MAKTIAPLTVAAIRSAKPAAKVLLDGGGLYLLLQDTGRHLWRFDYRFQGTRKTLSMGVYPDVSLADARERREEAHRLVANGIDPSIQRKAVKAATLERAGNSLEVVARGWFEKQKATWAKSYADRSSSA